MEGKLMGSVRKNMRKDDPIEMEDYVAAFMWCWQKWFRGIIKAKNADGTFIVWVIIIR